MNWPDYIQVDSSSEEEDCIEGDTIASNHLSCDHCDAEVFENMKRLKFHVGTTHNIKYQCQYCQRKFQAHTLYQKHLVKHSNEYTNRQFSCYLCNKKYDRAGSLLHHETRKHKMGAMFTCDSCPETFKAVYLLADHILMEHIDRDEYNDLCELRGKEFATKYFLDCHMKTEDPKYACEICGVKLADFDKLRRHEAIHFPKTHECDQCDMKFHCKSTLDRHKMNHLPKDKRKTFDCLQCDEKFLSKMGFDDHVNFHLPPDKREIYACRQCGDTFHAKHHRAAHEKIHLPGEQKKKYVCLKCNALYYSKNGLNLHEMICLVPEHEREKFPCRKGCDESFNSPSLRLKHEKSHISKKDKSLYVCKHCGKEYVTRHHHKDHEDKCTGFPVEKTPGKNNCSVCGKPFRDAYARKRHETTHLTAKERKFFYCSKCGKKLKTEQNLKYHENICQK